MTVKLPSESLAADRASHAAAAHELARQLARTAVARDREGGLPKVERDLVRASGLLKLTVPTRHGGAGQPLSAMLEVTRDLARVDPSLAHVFAFHHLMLASVRLYGSEAQWTAAYAETVTDNLFWGNALNPKDPRTSLVEADGRLSLRGTKSFCSGAGDSDRLLVSGHDASRRLVVAAIPTSRRGVRVLGDWDAIGQRQTDSGTVSFDDVTIHAREILRTPGPLGSVFASLRSCIAQSILVHIYLGIAEGAFAEARAAFAGTGKRPEPLPALRAGELYVALAGADALTERARLALDAAWALGDGLSTAQRGETAIAIAIAKTAATQAGLAVTTRIFELLGARAAQRESALDRYFRNLRTHTLHDPVDEKLREVGAWALAGEPPTPGFYG
ncbi:MAG: acyl-CoA dehydrogenase family protein [Polyangiales bacterium]